MIRLLGILLLVTTLYAVLFISNPNAMSPVNLQPLAERQGYFGVLTLGVGLLIISGGIDLSIGSVVGLSAVAFAMLMTRGTSPFLAAGLVLVMGMVIGLIHGLLVAVVRLQPFLVTLCGLFVYRGLARFLTDTNVGLGNVSAANKGNAGFQAQLNWLEYLTAQNVGGEYGIPSNLFLLAAVAVVLAVFLHGSVYGRYLYAIGTNEQAARYAGIVTARYKILAYMICSTMAALGGVLELTEIKSAAPADCGSFYELYAITGAVLGGCSLRGGEGTVVGILLGTAVLPLLNNLTRWLPVPETLQYTIVGLVLLLGTLIDELVRGNALTRWSATLRRVLGRGGT
jgi:ribose transport system permease protein